MKTTDNLSRTRHTFWEAGSLRCISIATKAPASCAVYVLDGGKSVCMEPCHNADEAAVLAERMQRLFLKPF
jgi:hypothetical protein